MWKFTDVAEEPATLMYSVGEGMGLRRRRHGTAWFKAVTAVFLRSYIVWDMTLPVADLFPPFRRDEAESWLTQPVSLSPVSS